MRVISLDHGVRREGLISMISSGRARIKLLKVLLKDKMTASLFKPDMSSEIPSVTVATTYCSTIPRPVIIHLPIPSNSNSKA